MNAVAADISERTESRLTFVSVEPGGRALRATACDPITELHRVHGAALMRFAHKLAAGDWQRAEDIVQETMIRAWRYRDTLDHSRNIRPWLFTVARRVATDMWRARARRDEALGDRGLEAPDPADHAQQVITKLDVRAALAALSPDHRQIIIETYFRHRSIAEAAEILGIPEGTVKSRIYYAMHALRKILSECGYRTEPAGAA
jgi:RNA polymerase sigma-70 factor (ECF subfamily)